MPHSVGITRSFSSRTNNYREWDLPAPSPLPDARLSALPSDSGSNLVSHEEPLEGTQQGALPIFYPSGLRENTPLSDAENSKGKRRWSQHFVGWRAIVLDSWLNILLVLIPVSWAIKLSMQDAYGLIFSCCVLALIPLVRLHDLSTAELAMRIGGSKTGLLNASMSNFVEVVLAISALRKCELRVVQSSLVGSILSKLLLILGLCFFAGGMRFSEQGFDATATQVHSSLLSISVGALLLPAAYHFTLSNEHRESADAQKRDILKMSHGVSVVLFFIYISYLAFQLWSHTHLYNNNHDKKSNRLPATQNISTEKAAAFLTGRSRTTLHGGKKDRPSGIRKVFSEPSPSTTTLVPPRRPYAESSYASSSDVTLSSRRSASSGSLPENAQFSTQRETIRLVNAPQSASVPMTREDTVDSEYSSGGASSITCTDSNEGLLSHSAVEDVPGSSEVRSIKTREPQLSWFLTVTLLVLLTAAVAITADWLVESMDGISTTISKEWVALILLPAISSVAECITAVRVSVKDELSLSVSVAIGSTVQTALFVIPFMVLLGWGSNKPLSLLMDPFQSLVLYISVQTSNYVLADGKSNWLEGLILVCLYLIIAVSFWFYPGSTPLNFLTICPV